jgi:hypothetical protein
MASTSPRYWLRSNTICILLLAAMALPVTVNAWGFWAHRKINRMAVFTLPPDMMVFFKKHIEYLTEESVGPDRRRYASPDEAPRHYIDLDQYGMFPFDSLPRNWYAAVEKYSEDTLIAHGILPWHTLLTMHKLETAFREKNTRAILRHAADLGHYIADAHVPLHTHSNYNGQHTDQHGIHAFWESRIPELFGEGYDYFVGKAEYIDNPSARIWEIVLQSASAVDSVLAFERALNSSFPSDQKYSLELKGNTAQPLYSEAYSMQYQTMLNGMIEKRMRAAIQAVASFWLTAWANAGQPNLAEFPDTPASEEELLELEEEKRQFLRGLIKGREHEN